MACRPMVLHDFFCRPQRRGHFARDIEKFYEECPKKFNDECLQLPIVCSNLAILHKSEGVLNLASINAALNEAANLRE